MRSFFAKKDRSKYPPITLIFLINDHQYLLQSQRFVLFNRRIGGMTMQKIVIYSRMNVASSARIYFAQISDKTNTRFAFRAPACISSILLTNATIEWMNDRATWRWYRNWSVQNKTSSSSLKGDTFWGHNGHPAKLKNDVDTKTVCRPFANRFAHSLAFNEHHRFIRIPARFKVKCRNRVASRDESLSLHGCEGQWT